MTSNLFVAKTTRTVVLQSQSYWLHKTTPTDLMAWFLELARAPWPDESRKRDLLKAGTELSCQVILINIVTDKVFSMKIPCSKSEVS